MESKLFTMCRYESHDCSSECLCLSSGLAHINESENFSCRTHSTEQKTGFVFLKFTSHLEGYEVPKEDDDDDG
eukprot:3481046-Amphidinium_carterae.2